ncbi:Oligosaccharyltransferase PglB [hydrothermal vent metagenome]|uniref:Oligosaccharyltransferase PglB n=1 Tax=hydrothermal vent metagenome TaxID=652676 RepID=A0A1W1BR59_9ZZZZ
MFKDNDLGWKEITILVVVAYLFSFAVRLIWVFQFHDNPNFFWHDQLMINTNDGYFFASAVEYLLTGAHADNPRVGIAINSYPGMVYASYYLTKFTPMSLETTILYAPAIISSLVVIPIVLTGKLIKLPWVGFFAALLGSIVWSYYNRTMVGYYDSDMFSVLLQFTVLYLFLLTIYSKEDKNILWLAFFILIYPLFYPQGLSLIYAIFFLWVVYQLIFQRADKNSYLFIIIASVSLWAVPIWTKIAIIVLLFIFIEKIKQQLDIKKFFYLTLFSLLIFFLFGNVFTLIISKVMIYIERGVKEEGLHFYQVIQTVREAGSISWETVANRIIGGEILLLVAIFGYLLLVIKHKQFFIALPLIGVGVFAHWAGLRFTVYAVPVAAFSVIYLFYFLSKQISDKKARYALFVIASILSLYPNITHIIGYKVPTVLNKAEVEDLTKLDKIADSKDYTLAWWDYGYPIWFYSDTSSLIDGAKHHNDNFIISKLMFSTSPTQVANLSRLAVETYVDSNYSIVTNTIFNAKENPNRLLNALKKSDFKLPQKTRDVYLYLPYKMMRIFPTVGVFGNINLKTGKKLRNVFFSPTRIVKQHGAELILANGIRLNLAHGILSMGKQQVGVYRLDGVEYRPNGKSIVNSQLKNINGSYCVVFLKSYGAVVIMDRETYNSTYVQMFMLEKYDKNLFELVVSSPYSKIYKIKR